MTTPVKAWKSITPASLGLGNVELQCDHAREGVEMAYKEGVKAGQIELQCDHAREGVEIPRTGIPDGWSYGLQCDHAREGVEMFLPNFRMVGRWSASM